MVAEVSVRGPVGGRSVVPSPPIVLSVTVGREVGDGLAVGSLVGTVNEWPGTVREGSNPTPRDSSVGNNTSKVEVCPWKGRPELETTGRGITAAHLTSELFRALLGQFIGKY